MPHGCLALLPKYLRCKHIELCPLLPSILWQARLKTDLTQEFVPVPVFLCSHLRQQHAMILPFDYHQAMTTHLNLADVFNGFEGQRTDISMLMSFNSSFVTGRKRRSLIAAEMATF